MEHMIWYYVRRSPCSSRLYMTGCVRTLRETLSTRHSYEAAPPGIRIIMSLEYNPLGVKLNSGHSWNSCTFAHGYRVAFLSILIYIVGDIVRNKNHTYDLCMVLDLVCCNEHKFYPAMLAGAVPYSSSTTFEQLVTLSRTGNCLR